MKISPIRDFSVQSKPSDTCCTPSFKGMVLDKAINTVSIPNNSREWARTWNSLLNSVKKEYGLRIVNQKLYDSLMEFCGFKADSAAAFFFRNNIESRPNGTAIEIARDSNDTLISLAKDETGCFIEFNGTEEVRRMGMTYSIGGHRFEYYQAPGVYIDFHDSFTTSGGPRRISLAGSDDKFYRPDGSRDMFGGIKNFVSEIKTIFKG